MKKLSLFTLFLSLFILSCQKESNILNQQKNTTFKLVDKPIVESLLSYKNEEDQKINLVCYLFADAVKKASLQTEFVEFMYAEMKNDVYNNGHLLAMSLKNPQFGAFITQSLTTLLYEKPEYAQKLGISLPKKSGTLNITNDFDVLKLLNSFLVRRGITYDPVIYFIKDSVTNIQERPIIAIGRRIPTTRNVPAWEGDNEIQLSELDVKNHEGLIIFVGTGTEEGKANTPLPSTSNERMTITDDALRGNIIQSRATVTVVLTQYLLKQDFDADDLNEVRGFVLRYTNSSTYQGIWPADFGDFSVHFTDIGTTFNLLLSSKEQINIV